MKEVERWDYRVIAVAPKDKYSVKIEKEGIHFIPIEISRSTFNLFQDIKLCMKLFNIYQEWMPGITHHFTIKPIIYGSIAARLAKVSQVVNSITGLGYIFSKKIIIIKLISTIYKFILRFSNSSIIFQNPDDKKYFLKNSLAKESKMFLIYGSGVNVDDFSMNNTNIVKQEYVNGSKINIFLFSRMIWDKGVKEYVDCAKQMSLAYSELHFFLIGSGDPGNPKSIPRKWLQDVSENKGISWIEHVEDVKPWMILADIIVLPSYYKEGVPRSLIEAASFEKPIITTDTPGCREIVKNEFNGLLVPIKDSTAIMDAIVYLLNNKNKWNSMGSKGRQLVLKNFDEKLILKQTLEVYNLD